MPVSAVHPYEAEGPVPEQVLFNFVAVPEEGLPAIRLLQQGMGIEQVRARLREETGADLDVDDFVADLSDAGLVAKVEGRPVSSPT
ncbi:hypothetical protein [Nonomuraea wenchangensis]|uniref:hypothetical protein n=1 Tax=Nonomuraea wenchangensis TaxID=568860 RepID=UPI0033D3D1FD